MLHGCFPPTVNLPTLTTSPEGPALGRGLAVPPALPLAWPSPRAPARARLPVSPSVTWRKIKPAFLSLPQQANLSAGRSASQGCGGRQEQLFAAAAAWSTRMKDAPGTNQHHHSSVRMKTASAAAPAWEGRRAQAKRVRKQVHHWGADTFLAVPALTLRPALMASDRGCVYLRGLVGCFLQ